MAVRSHHGGDERFRPVLVVGAGRSGTTWIGRALGHTANAVYVHEPDNHGNSARAVRAKAGLGCFPAPAVGDDAPRYARLWEAAFAGSRPHEDARARIAERLLSLSHPAVRHAAVTPGMRTVPGLRVAGLVAPAPRPPSEPVTAVVKSVQAHLALDWLRHRFAPRVVIVQRDPLNILSSWLELGWGELGPIPRAHLRRYTDRWGVPLPADADGRLERLAWRVGFLCAVLDEHAARTDAAYVIHDHVCGAPSERLAVLAADIGLDWAAAAEAYVRESQRRDGSAYDTHRNASRQPERWRERLTADQVRRACGVLDRFPLTVRPGSYWTSPARSATSSGMSRLPGGRRGFSTGASR